MSKIDREIKKKIEQQGDFEIVLGSDLDCDLAFTGLRSAIASRHAALKRVGDRLFIRDLNSEQGTFVNGHRIGKRWHEITLNDDLLLGIVPVEIQPKLLLGRDRVGIHAHDLFFSIPDRSKRLIFPPKRILTNHITIDAEPGKLIGVMGPSGAGKTVLLNLLSGYIRPEKGKVLIGDFNVHKSFGLIKDIIGDVPQDDTLIPELTVYQSLHYCLRLGYPDMRTEVRDDLIQGVLKRMGFGGDKLKTLLHTKIGSPEQRGLSGGERRRVNIAHELVRNPLILFLDEPTSGLSSVDSEYVVHLLKEICDDKQVTILMTIHQPSEAVFYTLDELLLLNRGGNVAYFGSTKDVVPYFAKFSHEPSIGNPAEYVLKVLDKWNFKEPPEKVFLEKQKSIDWLSDDEEGSEESLEKSSHKLLPKKGRNVFYQFYLLLERNLRVKISDKTSTLLLFGQVFVIAFLLTLTFNNYTTDHEGIDHFARVWYKFISFYDESVQSQKTLVIEPTFSKSSEWATTKEEAVRLMTGNAAQRRASILFLVIASSIWFGIINSSREVVAEKYILKRETRSSLNISSYLFAKMAMLGIIALIQTGILLGITCYILLPVTLQTFLQFWFILILTSVSASALSLMISSAVKTEQSSLMAVPILIIPQLLLGGLVRPVKYFETNLQFFTDFILQKWSFKAMLVLDSLRGEEVLTQIVDLENRDPFHYLRFLKQSISGLFFGEGSILSGTQWIVGDIHSVIMILFHGLVPFALAYLILKRKYF